jgi:hypothetical protein
MDCVYRHDLPGLRASLRKLGAVVAEVDEHLRYVWIDNPHPDFEPPTAIGRCDDELIPPFDAAPIVTLKREAWQRGVPISRTLRFQRSDGERAYTMMAFPVVDEGGQMEALLTVGFETKAG